MEGSLPAPGGFAGRRPARTARPDADPPGPPYAGHRRIDLNGRQVGGVRARPERQHRFRDRPGGGERPQRALARPRLPRPVRVRPHPDLAPRRGSNRLSSRSSGRSMPLTMAPSLCSKSAAAPWVAEDAPALGGNSPASEAAARHAHRQRPRTPGSSQPRWWASSWRTVRSTCARSNSGSRPKSRSRVSWKMTMRSE